MARTDTPDFGNKELEEDLRRIRDGLPQLNGYADREAALIAAEKEKERQRQEEEEEEKERVRQERENEINSPGHSIAATAWSDWHMRVYFQNDEGGVHEAIHDDGVWKNGLSRNALFGARPQSPLAAISWHSGQQIRIYYLNHENIIHEYCYWAGKGWYAGNLNNLRVRAACYSRITAIHWPVDCSIRIYFQEPGSTTIQEYCYSSRNVGDVWTRGTSLYNACQGSALAATRWISGTLDSLHRNLHIRLYYQDSDLNLRELCWKFGGWSLGGFARTALEKTPITANGWYNHQKGQIEIRVYLQNSQRTVVESTLSGWPWRHKIKGVSIYPARAFAAVELQNGIHHRVYTRNDSAACERCRYDSQGADEWFDGEYYENIISRK